MAVSTAALYALAMIMVIMLYCRDSGIRIFLYAGAQDASSHTAETNDLSNPINSMDKLSSHQSEFIEVTDQSTFQSIDSDKGMNDLSQSFSSFRETVKRNSIRVLFCTSW